MNHIIKPFRLWKCLFQRICSNFKYSTVGITAAWNFYSGHFLSRLCSTFSITNTGKPTPTQLTPINAFYSDRRTREEEDNGRIKEVRCRYLQTVWIIVNHYKSLWMMTVNHMVQKKIKIIITKPKHIETRQWTRLFHPALTKDKLKNIKNGNVNIQISTGWSCPRYL